MHVYTLVWLKSDQIRFLIVELKHPHYSIDSGITPACIRSSGSDWIWHSAQARDFSPGPWVGSRRTAALATFLQNHCKKERHCAPVCVIIMYTIYEVYKDVASSRTASFLNAEAAGDVKRSARGVSVTTSWNGYNATYRTGVWHAPANNLIFSLACILG